MEPLTQRLVGQFIIVFSSASLCLLAANSWSADAHEQHSAENHTEHLQDSEHQHDADHDQHAQHSAERDEQGRRLHGMKHEVNDKIADELRAKMPSFKKSGGLARLAILFCF